MAIDYTLESYALVNTPIETARHVGRVRRYLDPQRGDRILEVGCGRGFLTRRVQELAPYTVGVDINPESIRHGVTRDLFVMSAERLQFADATFDKLYSFHCLEHVANLAGALDEIARVLKPGGRALLVYPAEPLRGLYAVPAAIAAFRNPFRARELHLRRLSPWAIREYIAHGPLEHVESELQLLLTPQFVQLLRKRVLATTPAG